MITEQTTRTYLVTMNVIVPTHDELKIDTINV